MTINLVHLVSKWKYPNSMNRCQELSNGRMSLEKVLRGLMFYGVVFQYSTVLGCNTMLWVNFYRVSLEFHAFPFKSLEDKATTFLQNT
jgi:hypothetical protein